MKWPPLFLLLLIIISGCETDFEKARKSSTSIKNGRTNEQRLYKKIEFEAFRDGENIGSCNYFIEMLETVIGHDTLWLITDVDCAVAKGAGFYFYKTLHL